MYYIIHKVVIMPEFTCDLEELLSEFNTKKINLIRNLEKNYRENIHYIKYPVTAEGKPNKHGGHNRIVYMLTEEASELFKNSFNFRTKYLVTASEKIQIVKFPMCIEGQTIGFIENAYSGACAMSRQFQIGPYFTDLCFTEYKIVVECDEYGHSDRSETVEAVREEYINKRGYIIIRYNPNKPGFDLSDVLNDINMRLF